MNALPFSPAEHYGFSTGLCHAFTEAARAHLGGMPVLLMATDPRQLEQHDWPEDEPLALHVFLQMPDGSVVDSEGRRSLPDLLDGFGVRAGYRHALIPDPDFEQSRREFGQCTPELIQLLQLRLKEQGWTAQDIPPAANTLKRQKDYQRAQAHWCDTVWPQYQQRLDAKSPKPGRTARPR